MLSSSLYFYLANSVIVLDYFCSKLNDLFLEVIQVSFSQLEDFDRCSVPLRV